MENVKNAVKNLLQDYKWRYTDSAVDTIVDTWAENKSDLIKAFKKHPNYVDGKYLIAMDNTYTRVRDDDAIESFLIWLEHNVIRERAFIDALPDEVKTKRREQGCTWLPHDLFLFLSSDTKTINMGTTISDEFYEICNREVPDAHIGRGSKTTRAYNKLFTYLGYNRHEEYNRRFAKFADALNPLTVVKHTVVSLNPVDYLTMSFGNSWSSCHTIDTRNERNMPNSYHGMYCSGTMSYMLDGTSIIMYTVESSYDGDDYYTEPKTSRQMFHYSDGKLVQGRLYPNEHDRDAIDSNRELVQSVLAECFGFANMWVKKDNGYIDRITNTIGTHYQDYNNFRSSCTFTVVKDYDFKHDISEYGTMVIGHRPICIQCGEEHSDSENINCCVKHGIARCECCGDIIYDEDYLIIVDGKEYCKDCVQLCPHCNKYHPSNEMGRVHGGAKYCHSCLVEMGYSYCDHCKKWKKQKVTFLKGVCKNVCEHCIDEYRMCRGCGDWYWYGHIRTIDSLTVCGNCSNKAVKKYFESITDGTLPFL